MIGKVMVLTCYDDESETTELWAYDWCSGELLLVSRIPDYQLYLTLQW